MTVPFPDVLIRRLLRALLACLAGAVAWGLLAASGSAPGAAPQTRFSVTMTPQVTVPDAERGERPALHAGAALLDADDGPGADRTPGIASVPEPRLPSRTQPRASADVTGQAGFPRLERPPRA